MAYKSRANEVPKEVRELLKESDEAREVVRVALIHGKVRLTSFSRWLPEQDSSIAKLTNLDVLMPAKDEISSLTARYRGDGQQAMSDAVIYAQATGERAGILDENIGERVRINGIDGVLVLECGDLRHITKDSDGLVQRTCVPVSALTRCGRGLSIGRATVSFAILSGFHEAHKQYHKMLEEKGVQEAYSRPPDYL